MIGRRYIVEVALIFIFRMQVCLVPKRMLKGNTYRAFLGQGCKLRSLRTKLYAYSYVRAAAATINE